MKIRPRSPTAKPTIPAAPFGVASPVNRAASRRLPDVAPLLRGFDAVFVNGAPMLAFPAGRHTAMTARPARVTVCVPVYDGERNLERCLRSIEAQDFTDIDIIVVDNGSTDGSLARACAAATRDRRVLVYQNAENVGRVGNWNRCLDVACGEFVKPVMVNDFLAPECVRRLVDAMEAHPDAVLVRSSLTILQQGGVTRFLPLFAQSQRFSGPEAIRYCVEEGNIAAGPTSQLFRHRVIVERQLRFDTTFSWAADYDFAVQLLESGDFVYVREPLFVFDETVQRYCATRLLVPELRDELAIRVLSVARNPSLFPSHDAAVARCAKLCHQYLVQSVDASTRTELLAVFEGACKALLQQESGVAVTRPAEESEASSADSTTASHERDRFLQLPTSPPLDAGAARRVCIVTHGLSEVTRDGGLARWVSLSAEALVGAGHAVTVLLASCQHRDAGTFSQWIADYRRRGIDLQVLGVSPVVPFHGPKHVIVNREVYEWLKRAEPFDVIHFNEFEGIGHYTLLAKHQGLAFEDTMLCVTVQCPHLYLKDAMEQHVTTVTDMELDFVERRTVELADIVISPSEFMLEWMQSQEWALPARSVVQQRLVASIRELPPQVTEGARPLSEVVFFGALEDRKGVSLFCEAMELVQAQLHVGIRVTFLGNDGVSDGISGKEYITRRCASWTLPVSVLSDLESAEALGYLAAPGRLAVMASRLDNSPYALMECLEHGIPFLASCAGGVAELIAREDVERVCYERSAASLASRLARALNKGVAPARHRIPPADRIRSWLAFHQTIPARRGRRRAPDTVDPTSLPLVTMCITHFNRAELLQQAVASVAAQDYPNLELVIVDDGSTDPAAVACLLSIEAQAAREDRPWRVVRQENRYLGAARNTGVQHARGEYVAFLDDDDIAKPHRISTQVRAATRTRADIVLAGIDEFYGMEPPKPDQVPVGTWIGLGACVSAGTLWNCFGAVHALVRRSSILALGGFREVVKVGHEDYEFWARAVHAGQRLELVPEALNWYRLTPGSMLKTTSPYANDMLSLQPHLDAVPLGMRPLVRMALGNARQHTHQLLERSQRNTAVNRKVITAARLFAAGLEDAAASMLADAVRDAFVLNDTAAYLETLCDVGAVLSGMAAHRESGLRLLEEAVRLAEAVSHSRGREMAAGLLEAIRAAHTKSVRSAASIMA